MNRTVLVTGATGNMGKAVIEKFIASGDRVFTSLMPGETNPYSGKSNPVVQVADLQEETATADWVASVTVQAGHIDIAVLTVGGYTGGKLEETSFDAIENQVNLNFKTAYNVARPVFLQMKKRGEGRIFLVGSRPGLDMKNTGGTIAYGLSKSLIFRLSEILNHEAKGTQVVTSVIVPSTIDTPQNRKAMPDADFSRWVNPSAFADIIFFYSSQQAESLREPILKIYNKA